VNADIERESLSLSVHKSDMTIGGITKTGMFFPDTKAIDQVKAAVPAAWRDWKTFGSRVSRVGLVGRPRAGAVFDGWTKAPGRSCAQRDPIRWVST
jgi:hypothetical protein